MCTEEINKVVVPHRPVFDKIAAAAMVILLKFNKINQTLLSQFPLEFREDQHPKQSTWERWEREGALVIDVGRQKYQLLEKGSASAAVASSLEIDDPVLLELAQIADENNKTGYLKNSPHAVAWILREMYKIEGFEKVEVVHAVMDVIYRWVQAQNPQCNEKWPERTKESFFEEPQLAELVGELTATTATNGQGTAADEKYFADFTVGQYALNLWLTTPRSVSYICERCNFFLEAEKRARAEAAQLGEVFEATDRTEFCAGKCILLCTKEEMLGRWCLKNKPYRLIMIRPKRDEDNVVMLTRGSQKQIDLRWLAGALILIEGHAQKNQLSGRWYYDERINALLNGTVGHHVPATRLADDTLTALIELMVFYPETMREDEADGFAQYLIDTIPLNQRNGIGIELLKSILLRKLPIRDLNAVIAGDKRS